MEYRLKKDLKGRVRDGEPIITALLSWDGGKKRGVLSYPICTDICGPCPGYTKLGSI
jgi:hypothetical protein